jgi:hypothetical protein
MIVAIQAAMTAAHFLALLLLLKAKNQMEPATMPTTAAGTAKMRNMSGLSTAVISRKNPEATAGGPYHNLLGEF